MFPKRYYGSPKRTQPLDDKRINELYRYLNLVPTHLAVFKVLTDFEWHDVEDIYRRLIENEKNHKITRTTIALILSELQKILTKALLEHRAGVLTYSWRLNPTFKEFFDGILQEVDRSSTQPSVKRKYFL